MFTKNSRLAIAVLVGAATLGGMQVPASAAPRGPATLPVVTIKGAPAKWNPTSITVAPKPFTNCTSAKVVFDIANKTTKAATLSYSVGTNPTKHPLGTLPAGKTGGICSKGRANTKSTFYIKGSTSKLVVTLS